MQRKKVQASELTRKFSRYDSAVYVTVFSQLIHTTMLCRKKDGSDLDIQQKIYYTEMICPRFAGEGFGFYSYDVPFEFSKGNKFHACLTHWIISAPRINDSLPGRSRRLWWKFRWYLKFFNRRSTRVVGADYKKIEEEECNDCQQKAAMGKHFRIKSLYIYIYIFCLLRVFLIKIVLRFAQVHMYIHILEHTYIHGGDPWLTNSYCLPCPPVFDIA